MGLLQGALLRSTAARYNQLIDDIRNDVARIAPFYLTAHRVMDLDRRREASMQRITDLSPPERLSVSARVNENTLTVAWVQHSLADCCPSYRFALEHLAVAEPQPAAADADRALRELQETIDASRINITGPHFAAAPIAVAARQMPVAK